MSKRVSEIKYPRSAQGDQFWHHAPKWWCRNCGVQFGKVNEDWPKLTAREIKQLSVALVDSMVTETMGTKHGSLSFSMGLPKQKAKKNG